MTLSIVPVASAMRCSASCREAPPGGSSARSGPTVWSSQSRIAAESISVVPFGRVSEGTRPSGLTVRIESKSPNTERVSCSKAKPSIPSDTATRRV